MGNKIRLTIFLAKEDITSNQIIKEDYLDKVAYRGNGLMIYYDFKEDHPPYWASFFSNTVNLPLSISSSRVIVVRSLNICDKERTFILSFGQSQFMLEDDVFEEQFGLKILLNTLESDQIRQISKRSVGSNQKSSREQLPRGSDIFEFGFDIQRDLIKSIAGKNDSDPSFFGKKMLYGADLFSISSDYQLSDIDELLRQCYERFNETKYKEKFDWIDNIKEETSKEKKKLLDDLLLKEILGKNENIWMAVPHSIDWEAVGGFLIENDRETKYEDIEIDKVINSFKDGLKNIEQLKRKEIRAVSSEDEETPIYSWKAYKCIVGNITTQNNEEYCISEGRWYRINRDFVKEINEKYEKIHLCEDTFLDYDHFHEDDYNDALSKSLRGSIEMHTNLVTISGRGKMEACDVFWNNKIIHIKKNGGSNNLSHLFMQASNSSILWGTIEGRNKLMNVFPGLTLKEAQNKDFEIVVGIINPYKEKRPKIPFFSKITACYVADELESKNFRFSLKNIINNKKNEPRKRKKKSIISKNS